MPGSQSWWPAKTSSPALEPACWETPPWSRLRAQHEGFPTVPLQLPAHPSTILISPQHTQLGKTTSPLSRRGLLEENSLLCCCPRTAPGPVLNSPTSPSLQSPGLTLEPLHLPFGHCWAAFHWPPAWGREDSSQGGGTTEAPHVHCRVPHQGVSCPHNSLQTSEASGWAPTAALQVPQDPAGVHQPAHAETLHVWALCLPGQPEAHSQAYTSVFRR